MSEGTQAADRYAVISRSTAWLMGFLAFTAIGLLNFAYRYLDDLARQRPNTFPNRILEEMTGAYAAALLFPFLLRIVRRIRIHRDNWTRTVPLHLLTMIGFSVCNTTLMAISRSLLWPLVGLGHYDYGIMTYRYPMELAQHVLAYCMLVGGIYFFDFYREARNRQLDAAELQSRLSEAQLQNLKLQLQPHFLFNALNTISSVMHEDVGRADAMLAQLSDLLRRTLHTANAQQVSLEEEFALLRSYLGIMQARFGDKLNVDFSIDPAVSGAMVPQLLLQPLVENSIRHGREAQGSRLDIRVRAQRENGNLLLQVADNGPGITDLRSGEWRKGIGLSNTEERLETLYGNDHQFILENGQRGGLTVSVRLPLRTLATAKAR